MVFMAAVGPEDESSSTAAMGPDLGRLLTRSARGDEAAFAELYDATAARLHGLVVRVVRDRAQSEEVTQEAYLDIWRHCTRFDPSRGSPLAWMLTIAHRKAVDRVRSAEASKAREVTYESTTIEREHDTTLEKVETRLDQQRVRRALDSLTETQRGAVELAYLGGHTHTEVAALLGIPLGTAKTRIRDGLIRLRDTLEVTA
ncbi:RNA polymerase sigma factor SigK [Knoellia sinensis KCTC 19936]|uniref:RNA polymerase sigma factor SigK n=1 Tax=Knoellia sinensis KCTC 19936 TaxID=1385520 RepID=A0A0A0JAT3_9MICO|nr:RNA polymerase sigma factor SigK [Knoellia sinensis KCTC 19936]